jgi:Gluconate 2-dehydrogenase subunit 3
MKMQRRQLLKHIALLTGCAVVGGDVLLSGCKNSENNNAIFSLNEIALFDEIAETIIPKTDTPGAKEAAVGAFMVGYTKDCYTTEDQKRLQQGLVIINEKSNKLYEQNFISLNETQKSQLLNNLEIEAEAYNKEAINKDKAHFYTLIKQLTLLGFFSSEVGMTKVLRYIAVPGEYEGVVDYVKGSPSWA